ncbi:MAG: rhomboid family intramembrane serine protease [Gaiellaceae bacterium]
MTPSPPGDVLRCYRHPDRETGVSCSDCGRGICTDCMTFGSVGIRCPDHSGKAQGAKRVVQNVQRRSSTGTGIVTMTLIGINVGIYLLQLAGGASINANSGWIFEHGALYGPLVASGDWERLLTAAFLHYGPIHLGMNMLALLWIGRPLEDWLGPLRYILLYLVAGIAGSAGALIANTTAVTVGASGAIFGILGAAIVLERQRTYVLGGSAVTLLVVNLAFTFAVPGISIGGHLGGLAGGALAILALSQLGRRSAVHSRIDLISIASLVAIGLLSVAVAYWKVRGYA